MRKFSSLSLGQRCLVAGLVALLILALIGGFYGLEQTVFAHAPSLAVASPTTQGTMTGQSPAAGSSPTVAPSPTATPSPTASPQPTVAPSPTAKPSPAILAVTPNTYYVDNCTVTGRSGRTCTFTLHNSSSTSPLAWTAKAWNSQGVNATKYLPATSGTIPSGGTTPFSFYLDGEMGVCTLIGTTVYLQFTGPKNVVTVTITC